MRAIVGRERAQDEAGRGQGRLHGDVVMSAQECARMACQKRFELLPRFAVWGHTCTSRECAELFSLFSSFDGDCQSGPFLIQRNRDKLSTRKFERRSFHTAWVMNGPDAHEMRCPLLSRKQTSIGRRRKVGFLDLIPKSLRTNQAHRSASSSRQRIDHPPPEGLTTRLVPVEVDLTQQILMSALPSTTDIHQRGG